MLNKRIKHLKALAKELEAYGFEVETPKNDEYLDVWGFETIEGRKRRRRCFEEIYCTFIDEIGENLISYWSTNYTYDNDNLDVEVCQSGDIFFGLGELISKLSVEPIKKRNVA